MTKKFAAYGSVVVVLVSMAFLWREVRRQWMYIADIASTVRQNAHHDHEVHRAGYEITKEMTKKPWRTSEGDRAHRFQLGRLGR